MSKEESLLDQHRKQPWWVLVILATMPPLVTGYYSYQAAVVDAKTKAAEARRTSEAGYEELVRAVETLQKHDEDTVKAIAGMNGHIESIEKWIMGMRPHVDKDSKEVHLDLPVPKGVANKRKWRPSFPPKIDAPEVNKLDMPQSLDALPKK